MYKKLSLFLSKIDVYKRQTLVRAEELDNLKVLNSARVILYTNVTGVNAHNDTVFLSEDTNA